MAMVQLLLGNIGVAGGGMNALRGHSNIQGLTDLGLLSNPMPGYLDLADETRSRLRRVHEDAAVQAAASGPDQLLAELHASSSSASRRHAAATRRRAENDWAYDWLPKLDIPLYDMLAGLRDDGQGQDQRLHLPGLQPAAGVPRQGQDPPRRWRS